VSAAGDPTEPAPTSARSTSARSAPIPSGSVPARSIPPIRPRLAVWARARQLWLDLPMRGKGTVVLALPMTALIVIAALSLALLVDERANRTAALQADQLVSATQNVLITALDAETGVQAYAATPDPSLLAPYHRAVAAQPGVTRALEQAASGSHETSVATALTGDLDAQMALLAQIVAGARDRPVGPLLAREMAGLDGLRDRVSAVNTTMTQVVASRRSQVRRIEDDVVTLEIVGLIVGAAVGVAGMLMFTAGVARRLRRAVDNARRLGDGQRLAPTPPAHDELGDLAVALDQAEALLAAKSDELTVARDEALTATQAKNQFLSRISHELRTPLNAILGFAQLLDLSDLSERDHDDVAHILTAGRYLVGLINEVLDISRIEAGEMTLSLEPVPVAGAINDVIELMRPLAADRSITIDLRSPGEELACQADKQRLNQVLLNLVSNAIKYNRDSGQVAVSCAPEDGSFVAIAVRDTGPGFTPAQLERLFVPFDRLGAEAGPVEGTGIGLSLAKSLSEAMGGELDVMTTTGAGSTFTVRLPRAGPTVVGADRPSRDPAGHRAGPASETRPPRPARPARRVVYIEDNLANVKVVQRLLAGRPDIVLDVAGSGQLGIDLARQRRPALILLDLHLPDLSGEVVLQRLRAEPATAGVPVYVLSADASPGSVRRLQDCGASGYLLKPLNLRDLLDLVEQVAGDDNGSA
jgi:signal transduction histidine kinase/CheY-like chemotaxis protein